MKVLDVKGPQVRLKEKACDCQDFDFDVLKTKDMSRINATLLYYDYPVDNIPVYTFETGYSLKKLSKKLDLEVNVLISLIDYSILEGTGYDPNNET